MAASKLTEIFFMAHHADFESNLNVDALISKLNSRSMLTYGEMERLISPQTTQNKIIQLIQILCKKGSRAPYLFIECLRSATDHLAHSDLADKMEQWLKEHPQPGSRSISAAATSTPGPQQPEPAPDPRSSQELQSSLAPPFPQVNTFTVGDRSQQVIPTVNVDVSIHFDNSPHIAPSVNTSHEQTAACVSLTNTLTQQTPPSSSDTKLAQPIPEQHTWQNTRPPIQQPTPPSEVEQHPISPIKKQSNTTQSGKHVTPVYDVEMVENNSLKGLKRPSPSRDTKEGDRKRNKRSSPEYIQPDSLRDETSFYSQQQNTSAIPNQLQPSAAHCCCPCSSQESPLQVFVKTLKKTYLNRNLFMRTAGPRVAKKLQFINLALVKKQRVSHLDKEKDEFLCSTLHGSVDDILKKKEEIGLEKIFKYNPSVRRKLVLVEGAPGVGKTMLALQICQMWAKGKFLKEEYGLVLLVTLRRFQGKPSVEFKDIVHLALEGAVSDGATQALFHSQGEKTLLILEGWDELPPELREEGSFFFDLVQGNKLPDASVLVTSRPTVTADLYDYMDERHIEVLGFNSDQVAEYVKVHGGDMAESIAYHLEKFPNLKALAHIPLTLTIICHVADREQDLPHTLTELYDQHICNTLFQNLKKHGSLIGLPSLEDLPDKIQTVIQSLCTLALDGFKEKKFVYSHEDLQRVGLKTCAREAFDGHGLLNTPINSAVAGFEQVFQFSHLSIQEFLAAYEIQGLKYEERVDLLAEFRGDTQFRNIWKFFSGITKLEDQDFREIVLAKTAKANRDQIFLLHCLYEANNPTISQVAADKMYHVLNLNNMFLNTTDCLCAAHMITSAGGEWSVDLRGCNIGEEGLRIIKMALRSHIQAHGADSFKITRFNLIQNRIKSASISHLVDLLTCGVHMEALILSANPIGDTGVCSLAEALKRNGTVSYLEFCRCGLTSVGASSLAEMLEENKSIKEIMIQMEPIGDEGVVSFARALEKNKTLIEITLTKVGMTSVGLAALTKMAEVNQTLQTLRVDRNGFEAKDCELLAVMLINNNSLQVLDLCKNPIGNEGFEIILEALIAKPTSSLKRLTVYGCGLTPKGLQKLTSLFSVTTVLVSIQLGGNEIGNQGAEVLCKAILQNTSRSVKNIILENTNIPPEGKQKLQETCDTVNADRDQDSQVNVCFIDNFHLKKLRDTATHL